VARYESLIGRARTFSYLGRSPFNLANNAVEVRQILDQLAAALETESAAREAWQKEALLLRSKPPRRSDE